MINSPELTIQRNLVSAMPIHKPADYLHLRLLPFYTGTFFMSSLFNLFFYTACVI